MRSSLVTSPYEVVYLTILTTGIVISLLLPLYYVLRSKRIRLTNVYLSGEPENVVAFITPSIMALYWGFMKKFAKSLYRILLEGVHTGSLHDWFKFLSSWLSILLIAAIAALMIAIFTGVV